MIPDVPFGLSLPTNRQPADWSAISWFGSCVVLYGTYSKQGSCTVPKLRPVPELELLE
jgi:hypothetical protein